MKPDKPEEPYKDKDSLLENLRESFSDPSLSQDILRENGCALAEEYTAILQQLSRLAELSDTTQRKLLNADLKIQAQQEELGDKNARLEQELTEHIELRKQLQQRTEELTAINNRLTRTINELTQRNLEILTLQQLGEFLQACESEEETFHVLISTCRRLFPADAGYLSLLDDSMKVLRVVGFWGDDRYNQLEFEQQRCWAVRRGKAHSVQDSQITPVCPHSELTSDESSVCVPMTAHGQVLGMMYLLVRWQGEGQAEREKEQLFEAKQRLFVSMADRYAMSLTDLRLRETLKVQAIRDPLTGLYNRRHMEASFHREISRAQRHDQPLGVIMIDIDHFNVFNDTYGHDLGDRVLSEIGAFVLENVRDEDIACRYGGEEIIIILPGATLKNTHRRAEQLRIGIEALTVEMYDEEHTVTASLGVALFPEHGIGTKDVIRAADCALYEAKDRGRNRVIIAGKSLPSSCTDEDKDEDEELS
ncbi:MAG: diguanylate cyclase [Candidatus Electrothrix sp. GW3-4]|uniref:sensor domain-containing diguanylate cyclase n=1 Tax=Candidatus Electrothrix sp. GW3-4 TaxID=3126740 RepID=UPI0030CCE4C6